MELYNQFDDILTIKKSEDNQDLYFLRKSTKYLDGKVADKMCLCLSKKDILTIAGKLMISVNSTLEDLIDVSQYIEE